MAAVQGDQREDAEPERGVGALPGLGRQRDTGLELGHRFVPLTGGEVAEAAVHVQVRPTGAEPLSDPVRRLQGGLGVIETVQLHEHAAAGRVHRVPVAFAIRAPVGPIDGVGAEKPDTAPDQRKRGQPTDLALTVDARTARPA